MFQLICDILMDWKNYSWKMKFPDFWLFFMCILNLSIIYFLLEYNNEFFGHIDNSDWYIRNNKKIDK